MNNTYISAWKTNAWKSQQMAEVYKYNVAKNILKNKRETDLCLEYSAGKKILDIGIGTGRASAPLLAAGYDVTGIDSSESMLEIAAQELSPFSPKLICGDLHHLPFDNDSFDTVVSLNTLQHFPEWEKILKEWERVVKINGRMVFDLWSLDYERLFDERWIANDKAETFSLRLGVEDFIRYATNNNLKIIQIIPYGDLSDRNSHWIQESGINKSEWDRLLSRVYDNQVFFEFMDFLDASLFGVLSTATALRYMVVVEKSESPVDNSNWSERNQTVNRMLSQGLSLETVRPFLDNPDLFMEKLSSFLDNEYALVLIFKLWSIMDYRTDWLNLESFLTPRHWAVLKSWSKKKSLDTISLDFVEQWHKLPEFENILTYRGVPLGCGLEYELISETLTYFRAFEKDSQ